MCLTVALAYVIYVYVYMISEIDEAFLFLLLSIVCASGLVIYLLNTVLAFTTTPFAPVVCSEFGYYCHDYKLRFPV